ncbi:MAG: exosortase F system-associated protein [Flavobacteriaceae bacterium]
MKLPKTLLYIVPFIIGFALIRLFESRWFYDPFLSYFKGAYQSQPFPEFESFKLFFNLFLRYFLNTVLSLGIIFVLFRNKEFLKVASFLYSVFFVLLLAAFFYIVNYSDNSFVLFYVRRFLIQPLFLLLFVPAFYFQKSVEKNR